VPGGERSEKKKNSARGQAREEGVFWGGGYSHVSARGKKNTQEKRSALLKKPRL